MGKSIRLRSAEVLKAAAAVAVVVVVADDCCGCDCCCLVVMEDGLVVDDGVLSVWSEGVGVGRETMQLSRSTTRKSSSKCKALLIRCVNESSRVAEVLAVVLMFIGKVEIPR